jgi:F-type H+-transporting ATPase subunit b
MAAENTTGHTEVPSSGHGGGFPPFQKQTFPSQLFWLAIFFIALYVIASRLALPRVGGIIDKRKAQIDGDLAEANRLRGAADEALASYEKALADARARAQTIAGEMREKLQAEADKERKLLEERLNARLADAEKAIGATKAAAMANVRGIAVDAAAAIVTRLTGTSAPAAKVAAAVDAALKRAE